MMCEHFKLCIGFILIRLLKILFSLWRRTRISHVCNFSCRHLNARAYCGFRRRKISHLHIIVHWSRILSTSHADSRKRAERTSSKNRRDERKSVESEITPLFVDCTAVNIWIQREVGRDDEGQNKWCLILRCIYYVIRLSSALKGICISCSKFGFRAICTEQGMVCILWYDVSTVR